MWKTYRTAKWMRILYACNTNVMLNHDLLIFASTSATLSKVLLVLSIPLPILFEKRLKISTQFLPGELIHVMKPYLGILWIGLSTPNRCLRPSRNGEEGGPHAAWPSQLRHSEHGGAGRRTGILANPWSLIMRLWVCCNSQNFEQGS